MLRGKWGIIFDENLAFRRYVVVSKTFARFLSFNCVNANTMWLTIHLVFLSHFGRMSTNLYSQSKLAVRGWASHAKIVGADSKSIVGFIEDANVSHLTFLGVDGEFFHLFSPVFADKEEENGADKVAYFLIGNATDKLQSEALAKMLAECAGSSIALYPRQKLPSSCTLTLPTLPTSLFQGMAFEASSGEMVLVPFPSGCPIPFGTEPYYGSIDDPKAKRYFEKLGPEFSFWYDLLFSAFKEQAATQAVFSAIEVSASMGRYVPGFESMEVNPNGPYAVMSPVYVDSLEDSDLKDKCLLVVQRFSKVPASAVTPRGEVETPTTATGADPIIPAGAPVSAASISATDFLQMAKMFVHPEQEGKKKEDDFSQARLKLFFVLDEVDSASGNIVGDLLEPTFVPAFADIFSYKSASVRASMLQSHIESGMEPPPADDIEERLNSINQDRAFRCLPLSACNQLLKGNLSKHPSDSFYKQSSAVGQLAFVPQRDSDDQKINLLKSKEAVSAAEVDLNVPDAQRTKANALIETIGSLSNLADCKSLAANNIALAGLFVVPKVASSGGPVCLFQLLNYKIYMLLSSANFIGWAERTKAQQPQLYAIVFTKIESIWVSLASFASNSAAVSKMLAGDLRSLKSNQFLVQAVRGVHLFLQQTQDLISMGSFYRDVPAITPAQFDPEAVKEQALREQIAAIAGSTKPSKARPQDRRSGDDEGDTHPSGTRPSKRVKTAGGIAAPAAQPRRDPMKQGFFMPLPGCDFKKLFAPLKEAFPGATLPCHDHHAFGRACTKENCSFRHGGAVRFPEGWMPVILEAMLTQKSAVLNPEMKSSRRFEALVGSRFQSLWSSPEQMAADSRAAGASPAK